MYSHRPTIGQKLCIQAKSRSSFQRHDVQITLQMLPGSPRLVVQSRPDVDTEIRKVALQHFLGKGVCNESMTEFTSGLPKIDWN